MKKDNNISEIAEAITVEFLAISKFEVVVEVVVIVIV